MKKNYAVQDKTQDQQRKRAWSVHSYTQTTYSHIGQKAEMNNMIQKVSKAAISSFVKNSKSAKKRKVEYKIKNIDE